MIAADWKHGIFPMKRRSRPRYSVTSRDASMAGGVAGVEGGGRRRETLSVSRSLRSTSSGGWCARQGRSPATFALSGRARRSAFCALSSTQERRVLGREEHAHMVAK